MDIDNNKALQLAQEYLRAKGLGKNYNLDVGEVDDREENWIVKFPKQTPGRPNLGEVQVDKKDGSVKGVPLR